MKAKHLPYLLPVVGTQSGEKVPFVACTMMMVREQNLIESTNSYFRSSPVGTNQSKRRMTNPVVVTHGQDAMIAIVASIHTTAIMPILSGLVETAGKNGADYSKRHKKKGGKWTSFV